MVVVIDSVPDATVLAALLAKLLTGRDGRVLLDKGPVRCTATARGAHGGANKGWPVAEKPHPGKS